MEDPAVKDSETTINLTHIEEVRSHTIFAVMDCFGPDYAQDFKLGALQILKELPNLKSINDILTCQQSMSKIQDFLQIEDDEVKQAAFQFLSNLLDRFYPNKEEEEGLARSLFVDKSTDASNDSENYVLGEHFIEFLSLVVTEVVPFVLRLDQQQSLQTFSTQFNTAQKRLGPMRLQALQFLETVQSKLGVRMRMYLKDADIYNLLTEYFEAFPFNDIALQRVFNIYAAALNSRYPPLNKAKELRMQ
jgi:hypothetical protein